MKQGTSRASLRISAATAEENRPVLITGGAGFIGTNLAHRLLTAGRPVIVFDNLSRPGVERNLRWLRDTHGRLLRVDLADVRDRAAVQRAVSSAGQVVHLASQVAVTTSLLDPLYDFDVNARGTLNVLSALNTLSDPPPLLYTSTNKVYGCLDDIALEQDGRRYRPLDGRVRERGIDENRPLDFHSPYGCSKGAADQYVLDYARTFGLRALVFRMSCIYGPHQFGTEDQGWVAHFLIRALRGEPVTLFGNGMQVRDLLFVEDVVEAIELAFHHIDDVSGHAFNMGGGPSNTTSLLEVMELIGAVAGVRPHILFDDWRPADQRYYVSDATRFTALTGWRPRTGIATGIGRLHQWLAADTAATAAAAMADHRLDLPRAAAAAAGE
jgi:CDP-paratose 2-epimerase